MKKKFLGRVLTMLLVASMVFTLLPASAVAAGNWWWNADEYTEEAAPTATADNYSRILHLDCGRKYFTKDWIIALLHEMQDAGYNQLELAFGNDGLRFLLNDMTFVANGTTYDHDTIVKKVEAGNELQNSSGDKSWLNETEMNEIIAAAKSLGIEIVPLLNLPGHANAILDIVDNNLYNARVNGIVSQNTLAITDSKATEFAYALFTKYVDYFAGKGCKYFNFGADEYGNDIGDGNPHFDVLKGSGYQSLSAFINKLAGYIDEKGMTPRAFNDGLYYNRGTWDMRTSVNTNIPMIQCCYWSSGWGSYPVAYANTIAQKGHSMINTHGEWYYVLGKPDNFDKNGYSTSVAAGFENTSFADGNTISNPVGSMFCIWCDFPNEETEQQVAQNTRLILRAMAARMQDNSIDTINTGIVTGGFNEDGSLNTTPVQPDTGVVIKPEGGTTGKLDSTKNESIVLDAGKVVTWSYDPTLVTLKSADAASDVALADLATLSAQRVTVTPVAGASGTATITAADENGNSAAFPIEVVNSAAPADGPIIDLKVGQTSDPYTVKGNVIGQVDETDYDAKVATYQATPRTETTPGGEEKTTYLDGQEFYIKNSKGKYFNVSAKWGDKDTTGKTTTWIGRTQVGAPDAFYLESASDSKKYISCDWSRWIVGESKTNKFTLNADGELTTTYTFLGLTYPTTLGTPYKNVPGSSTAYTDITFTGVAAGTTYVTIGGTRYTINVSYYEKNVNVVLNQSTPVTVSGTLNTDGLNTDVATVSVSTDGTTMTVTGHKKGNTSVIVGNTKYHITVSTEDLEAVTPLKIEYWITNSPVQRSENDTTNYFTVSATMNEIATQNGVEVTAGTMIPKDGYRDGRTVDYWQCRLLDTSIENDYGNGTQAQTGTNGDDETTSGVAFTKVRYYGGHWAVYTEKNEWVEVKSNHQLVAYFLEIITIDNINDTRELYVNAADWGNIGSKTGTFGYHQAKLCAVAVQTVYEDGATNPEKTDIDSIQTKMLVYGLGTKRGLGTMRFTGENGNKIYKVTAETGKITYTASDSEPFPYSITGVEYHNNEENVWTGELSAAVSISNPTNNPTLEGNKQNLYWSTTRNDFILIRVYIKAPATKDSLTVHYMDETTGTASEFYKYSINVVKDTVFDPNFGVTNGVLHDNTVENYYGQPQTVKTDLKEMPEIDATYRFAAYQCERTTRSDDGKHVYLYYKFTRNAAFVADFGLPITIPFAQINGDLASANITDVTVTTQQYGTVTPDVRAKTITYTPNKTFGEDIESLNVTFSGTNLTTTNDGAISYQVYIYPASNVLYEASFLTQVSKDNGPAWKLTTAASKKQETQKVGDTTTNYAVFGRDTAYDDAYGALGAWTATGLDFKSSTGALTTSFYGNGFDLIGNCGPKTGRVILFVKNAETGKGKLVDVDTRYGADTFYQVPLAHVMMAEEASYNVTVYAAGLKATNATPASYSLRGAATYASDYAADSYDAVLNGILAENGLTMADVEYVKVESAPAAAKTARRATSFYALDTAAETGPVTHEAGDHVEIDGFRVYRSTNNTNNTNYPEGEKNVQYLNILDAVNNFTAFVEGSTADNKWEARDKYENAGGPQNEIYLRKTDGENSAIAFKVNANAIVQISARAVENEKAAKLYVNGDEIAIATNTEMYYTYTAGANGIVTIKNTGEGMLALGNLKIKNGTQAAALNEEDYPAAIALLSLNAAPETPDTVFEPTISAKVTTTRFIRSKVVTLTVSASADVAKLTVNGKELRPTNGWLVSMGWSKSYNYILTETVKKSETRTYEIIGYSADGTASTPTVVTSK